MSLANVESITSGIESGPFCCGSLSNGIISVE